MSLPHEIGQAKAAVTTFVDVFFTAEKSFSARDLKQLHVLMEPFSQSIPLPGGRMVAGKPIDFLAKSFWHACCIILHRWILERYAATEPNPPITVYRGQSNTWPIRPSLWRTPLTGLKNEPLEAIRDFLSQSKADHPNPTTEFFSEFLTLKGIQAFAQHHEFPTPLIDFSFHPMVALFFASRSSRPASITAEVRGMGVIYESSFRNFIVLQNRIGVAPELVMIPPSHVFRLYQQRGFFIDCGHFPEDRITQQIELACTKLFFPRTYPEMVEVEEVFSEKRMMSFIPSNSSPFKSSYEFDEEWYAAFDYYLTAIDALKAYCLKNPSSFNRDEAVKAMLAAGAAFDQPSYLFDMFGASRFSIDMILAESISNAAHTVFDITSFTGPRGKMLCQLMVQYYAQANPGFFEALFEMAKRVTIFDIEEIAQTFQGVKGLKELVAGNLSAEQYKRLKSITEIRDM